MNKIPKCSRKLIPTINPKNKKSNKAPNINKIKILTDNSLTKKSIANDNISLVQRKETQIKKKCSSCNERVNIKFFIFFSLQKNKYNNINSKNQYFQKKQLINKKSIILSSLDNSLKTFSGNRTFNLSKKSENKNNNKNIITKCNASYNQLNTLNNDRNKTINITNKNNSVNKINNFQKIPISQKKKKMSNKLVFSNHNLE